MSSSANTRGRILVLVAPSGSGKSTLANRLREAYPDLQFSISATTRPPREGEVDGRDYHFLSPEEFEARIQRGEFIEWEEVYNGTRYGTLRSAIENQRDKGYHVLLDIDVKGAHRIDEIFGEEALSVFIKPPSIDELERRLRARGTEDESSLQDRLNRAREELQWEDRFDRKIVNDDLETAWNELLQIVRPFLDAP
ncbi:MAG: guanylate kinase [Bacteroidota bacterium]